MGAAGGMGTDGSVGVIQRNERVFVAGKTGSGKSQIVGRYLAATLFPNVIVLDTKGDSRGGAKAMWPALARSQTVPVFTTLKELGKFGAGKCIFRPTRREKTAATYASFFDWILARGNTVVWVDEVYSVVRKGGEGVDAYEECLTQGRSRGVGVWTCTQRPMYLPNFAISEAEHYFIFRLKLPQDRAKVADAMEMDARDFHNPPGKHGSRYYRDGWEEPILLPYGVNLGF